MGYLKLIFSLSLLLIVATPVWALDCTKYNSNVYLKKLCMQSLETENFALMHSTKPLQTNCLDYQANQHLQAICLHSQAISKNAQITAAKTYSISNATSPISSASTSEMQQLKKPANAPVQATQSSSSSNSGQQHKVRIQYY